MRKKRECRAGRVVKLLVYSVSAGFCVVGLVNTTGGKHAPEASRLVAFVLLAMALSLFGAMMYQVQEGQREWQQSREVECDRDNP